MIQRLKLAIETLEQSVKYVQSYCHWNRSGVFIGNLCSSVFTVNFGQVNAGCDIAKSRR